MAWNKTSWGESWTAKEVEILRDKVRGKHWKEAAEVYFPNRSIGCVRRKLVRMGWGPEQRKKVELDIPPSNERQDYRFQVAMLKAIKDGLENAPIGIVTTPDDDFRPVRLRPQIEIASFCGSPALACSS